MARTVTTVTEANTDVLELLPKRGEDVDMDFVRKTLKVVV